MKLNGILKLKKCVAVILFLFVFTVNGKAQRLVPGQWEVSFGGGVTVDKTWPVQFEIGFNKVNYSSKMLCGLNVLTNRRYYISAEDSESESPYELYIDSRNYDIYASWGLLWYAVHNRTRSLNFWMGGTVDVGARVRSVLSGDGLSGGRIPSASFLYGFSPQFNFEVFPARQLSMSVYFKPHMQWYARGKDYSGDPSEPWFYPQFGLQMHIYL